MPMNQAANNPLARFVLQLLMQRNMINPQAMIGRDPRQVASAILMNMPQYMGQGGVGGQGPQGQQVQQPPQQQPMADEGEANQPYMNALAGAESISAREPVVDMSGPAAQDPQRIMGVSPQEIWARFSGAYPGAAQQLSDAARLANILSYVGLMPRGGMGGRVPMQQSSWPAQGRLPVQGPVSRLPQQTRTALADVAAAPGTAQQRALSELARRQANYEATVPKSKIAKTEADVQRLGRETRQSKGTGKDAAKYQNAPRHGRLQEDLEAAKTKNKERIDKKKLPEKEERRLSDYGTGRKGPRGGGFPEEPGRSGKAPKGSLMRDVQESGRPMSRGGRPEIHATLEDFERAMDANDLGTASRISGGRIKRLLKDGRKLTSSELNGELRSVDRMLRIWKERRPEAAVGYHYDDTGKILSNAENPFYPGTQMKKDVIGGIKSHEYGHRFQKNVAEALKKGEISAENKPIAEAIVGTPKEDMAELWTRITGDRYGVSPNRPTSRGNKATDAEKRFHRKIVGKDKEKGPGRSNRQGRAFERSGR